MVSIFLSYRSFITDTCRCSETITSATILLPPLVNAGSLEIIPLMLDKAIRDCCGNCSGKHGMSRVDWHRDSLGLNSVKHSKKEALDAIAAGTNLALPIFMDSLEMEGDVDKSLYVMVPLVQSKYLGIFIRRPTDREMGNIAASIISAAVKEQYPLLLISTVLTILAGILFWIFVSCNLKSYIPSLCVSLTASAGIDLLSLESSYLLSLDAMKMPLYQNSVDHDTTWVLSVHPNTYN